MMELSETNKFSETNKLSELDDNLLNQIGGGATVVSRDENGNIKHADYYCDKCGALVMTQEGSKLSKKMKFSWHADSFGTTFTCENCKKKEKA